MFVFLHTFAFGHISGEGGKQSAQELESASRRPTAVPTTSVVGVRPPRKFSTTPVFSFHWDLLRLWKTVAELWYNSIWHRFWNPILVNIIGGWRWQLEYKSEYLLFSSYRQAAWSERVTSRLSILFICCHFLRWKAVLCQIPIDRAVCNACDSDDQFWSKGGILPIGQPSKLLVAAS